MKKCLKLSIDIQNAPNNFIIFIQNGARDLGIEGTAQIVEINILRIIACGKIEQIEAFLDFIHTGYESWFPEVIDEEPFISNRDYRGTFRIIE